MAEVASEPVEGRPLEERVRYVARGEAGTLLLRRLDPPDALEASLLPFLARKTDRVPAVRARGIPPPAARARSWVLLEDVSGLPGACDDPLAVVRAKVAVERAVARDVPALRALGVPAAPGGALGSWPAVLVHGALGCDAARLASRGVVIAGWARASIGPGLLDVVTLARDAGADLAALAAEYARHYERDVTAAELELLRRAGRYN